jgi:hypothetical protein
MIQICSVYQDEVGPRLYSEITVWKDGCCATTGAMLLYAIWLSYTCFQWPKSLTAALEPLVQWLRVWWWKAVGRLDRLKFWLAWGASLMLFKRHWCCWAWCWRLVCGVLAGVPLGTDPRSIKFTNANWELIRKFGWWTVVNQWARRIFLCTCSVLGLKARSPHSVGTQTLR